MMNKRLSSLSLIVLPETPGYNPHTLPRDSSDQTFSFRLAEIIHGLHAILVLAQGLFTARPSNLAPYERTRSVLQHTDFQKWQLVVWTTAGYFIRFLIHTHKRDTWFKILNSGMY